MPVLVPRHFHSVAARLAEDLAAPQDDVRADHLLDQIEDGGVAGKVEEVAAAPHALGVLALDMGANEAFRPDSGIDRDEPVQRRAQVPDLVVLQAGIGNDETDFVISLDLAL